MNAFLALLRHNRNYRNTWIGQVVSEVGDHFNNIAVFSLAVATTKSGLVVSGVMLSRAIPAMLIGPLAGVVLDRLNRKTHHDRRATWFAPWWPPASSSPSTATIPGCSTCSARC